MPRSWSAAARMAPIVTSGAVSVVVISTLLCREALAVDTTCGPRQRLEPVGGDRVPAPDAPAERSGVETRQSLVDKRELALGAVPQCKIALLGEDLACRRRLGAVGHLARRDDRFADLVEQPGTLLKERRADRICAGHRGDGTRTYAPWEYAQESDDEHRDRPGLWHGGRHHDQPSVAGSRRRHVLVLREGLPARLQGRSECIPRGRPHTVDARGGRVLSCWWRPGGATGLVAAKRRLRYCGWRHRTGHSTEGSAALRDSDHGSEEVPGAHIAGSLRGCRDIPPHPRHGDQWVI